MADDIPKQRASCAVAGSARPRHHLPYPGTAPWRSGSRRPRLLARLARGQTAPTRRLKPGSVIVRQYGGTLQEVVVVPGGFLWCGTVHASLSAIARAITGTAWNGPRFFGLRDKAIANRTADTGNRVGRTTSRPKVRGSIQPSQTVTRESRAMPRSKAVIKNRQEARP